MKIIDMTLFENKTIEEKINIILKKHFPTTQDWFLKSHGYTELLDYYGKKRGKKWYNFFALGEKSEFGKFGWNKEKNKICGMEFDIYGRHYLSRFAACAQELENETGIEVVIRVIADKQKVSDCYPPCAEWRIDKG